MGKQAVISSGLNLIEQGEICGETHTSFSAIHPILGYVVSAND